MLHREKAEGKNAFDAEAFRLNGHALVDLLADHYEQVEKQSHCNAYRAPEITLEKYQNAFADDSLAFLELIRTVQKDSVHLHHPKFMGHQVVPPAPLSALAEFFAAAMNNGTAVYEMGAAGTAMEAVVIDQTAKWIGWEKAGGFMTGGGSLGNLTAMIALCRNPEFNEQSCIFISQAAHYCLDRGQHILGLKSHQLVSVETDDRGAMQVKDLAKKIQHCIQQGRKPFALLSNACCTSTGVFDPLNELSSLVSEHKLWWHVDAAHGGSALLSEKHRHRLKGLERADSVVIDYHKMWLCSAQATAVIFKNDLDSYRSFEQEASYLWEKDQELEWYNLGKRTLECTKYMMALKVFSVLKYLKTNTLAEYLEDGHALAKYLYDKVNAMPQWEAPVEPESNIVIFRFAGENADAVNASIRKSILQEGKFYIVQTRFKGKLFLRCTLMSPHTTYRHIDELLGQSLEFASKFA